VTPPVRRRLADEQPAETAAARARVARMSYEDAVAAVFETVGRLMAAHRADR
jgi:hypothetical protein